MYLQAGKVSSSGHIIVEKDLLNLWRGQELQKYGIEKNIEKDLAVNDEPEMALRRLLGENVGYC
ncbi:MAG: hypothetical protein WBE34_18275 [Candidatus Nitrosopolaris sp.]